MPPARDSSEQTQQELNPHRDEEQARAARHTADVLRQRGVHVDGGESIDELADILSAVERFEGVVQARGGDSMVNAPDSSDPENPDFVVPERRPGEPPATYIGRVQAAADRIRESRS